MKKGDTVYIRGTHHGCDPYGNIMVDVHFFNREYEKCNGLMGIDPDTICESPSTERYYLQQGIGVLCVYDGETEISRYNVLDEPHAVKLAVRQVKRLNEEWKKKLQTTQ